MKANPIRSANIANRLPTPKVNTAHTVQPMDLKPQGNTVALRTTAQNPFTQGRQVSVYTQQSGGMSKAPAHAQSRRLLNSYLPGLGEDPNAANQGTPATNGGDWGSHLISAGESYLDFIKTEEQAKIAMAQLEAEKAKAKAAQDNRRAQEAQSRIDAIIAMMGGAQGARKTSTALWVGGLALLGIAGFMMLRNKKAGRPVTGRRRITRRRR